MKGPSGSFGKPCEAVYFVPGHGEAEYIHMPVKAISVRRRQKSAQKSLKAAAVLEDAAALSSPIEKIFGLLEAFAREHRPLSLHDLAAVMQMPKTTVHRITMQLQKLGYLQREPGSRDLTIAPGLFDLAIGVLETSSRFGRRHEIVKALAEQLGEACGLGIRMGYEVCYLDYARINSALGVHFEAGRRAPLHCTSMGKVFLAHMKQSEWRQYLEAKPLQRYTDRTITTAGALHKVLEKVREQGFAITEQEYILGAVGAAVPVIGTGDRLYASLSVTAPGARKTRDDLQRAIPALQAAALRMAETIDSDRRLR